jgi:hypothetical protein
MDSGGSDALDRTTPLVALVAFIELGALLGSFNQQKTN